MNGLLKEAAMNDTNSNFTYEVIDAKIKWKGLHEVEDVLCAVGQYNGNFNDDHIFYWFDDWQFIFEEDEGRDFDVLLYNKSDKTTVLNNKLRKDNEVER